MVIILNELSLSGQFNDLQSFKTETENILPILSILEKLNIQVQKSQYFFQTSITQTRTLHQILVSFKSDDTYRAFKNNLLKLCNNPPFWEDRQKHSCEDEYICAHTQKTCNYGLAEAVEQNKVTLSFSHDSFKATSLYVEKNNESVEIENVYDINQLRKSIVNKLNSKVLTMEEPTEDYFPQSSLSSLFLKHCRYEKLTEGKGQEEKISIYKDYCHIIAILNSWEYSDKLSRINNRATFQRIISGRKHNLELDTENGTFEVHKEGYGHIDEYNFYGMSMDKRDRHRQTTF